MRSRVQHRPSESLLKGERVTDYLEVVEMEEGRKDNSPYAII